MPPKNPEKPGRDPVTPAWSAEEGTAPPLLRFGEYTVDVQRRALLRGNERLHLTEKPFSTLLLLVKNPGRVVSKRTIMDEVWKDTIVTEDNLVQAVSEIRRMLGDDKDDPRFVQTVPRDGYRFIAPIEAVVESPAAIAEVDEPLVAAPPTVVVRDAAEGANGGRSWMRWRRPAALLTGGAMLVVVVWLFTTSGEAPRKSLRVERQQLLSDFAGSHWSGSLSPDGQMIAYVDETSGQRVIWVRSVAGGNPVQVSPSDLTADRPRWSPAGDQIAFHGTRAPDADAEVDVWVVTPLGGTPRPLIKNARNANWSPDGKRIVFERGSEVWLANNEGQGQQRVDGVPVTPVLLAPRMPALSPDGSSIVVFHSTRGPAGDYWIVPLRGGEARRLTKDEAEGGAAVWTPDGESLIVPSRRGGSLTLWQVAVTGGTMEPVLGGAGDDSEPDISPDGRTLLFTNTRRDFVITVVDPATGTRREVRENRKGLLSPAFSPRGDRIVFAESDADESQHIVVMDTAGRDVRPLTFGADHHDIMPQWSADGRSVYFYRRVGGGFVRLSVDAGDSAVVGPGWTWEGQHAARVDPSGGRIVYLIHPPDNRDASAGAVRTIVREMASGKERTLPVALDHPRWSPDGEWLAGSLQDGPDGSVNTVAVCHVERGDCRRLTQGFDVLWSRDGRRIYFLRQGDSLTFAEVWSIGVDRTRETRHVTIGPLRPIALFYDVAPDGQIVYVQYRAGKSELWLAELGSGPSVRP